MTPHLSNAKTIWPDSALTLLKEFKYPFKNSFAGTVWSSCQARKYDNITLPGKIVHQDFYNPYFDQDNFNSTFALQEKNGELIKAPAIVLINGIFGNPLSGVARQLAENLLHSGYHVIALGNPLGPKNVMQKPKYHLGDFNQESKAFLLNVHNAVNWLKENTYSNKLLKWDTEHWGEIPADFGRK